MVLPTQQFQEVDGHRLAEALRTHFARVWRTVLRMGFSSEEAEDIAQQALIVLSRRLEDVGPSQELSFLLGTALRIAANQRRTAYRHREVGSDLHEVLDPNPSADELVEQKQARALLQQVLESLPEESRAVFLLYELEGLSLKEICAALTIPMGTAASRLRRGRERYLLEVGRLRKKLEEKWR